MPKETINSRYHKHNPNDSCTDMCEVRVEIGWGRGLPDVQIGTVNPTKGDLFDPAAGWYAHLDRADVNSLIRSLRKARDQAFGADA